MEYSISSYSDSYSDSDSDSDSADSKQLTVKIYCRM